MSGEPPGQAPSNFGNGGSQLEGILGNCSKFSEKASRCHILQVRCPPSISKKWPMCWSASSQLTALCWKVLKTLGGSHPWKHIFGIFCLWPVPLWHLTISPCELSTSTSSHYHHVLPKYTGQTNHDSVFWDRSPSKLSFKFLSLGPQRQKDRSQSSGSEKGFLHACYSHTLNWNQSGP